MSDDWQYKGGEGLWKEYINPQTNESTLEEHKLKLIWQSCPKGECVYELTNSGQRECTCKKCGSITHFVVGLSKLVDGKLISLR